MPVKAYGVDIIHCVLDKRYPTLHLVLPNTKAHLVNAYNNDILEIENTREQENTFDSRAWMPFMLERAESFSLQTSSSIANL